MNKPFYNVVDDCFWSCNYSVFLISFDVKYT